MSRSVDFLPSRLDSSTLQCMRGDSLSNQGERRRALKHVCAGPFARAGEKSGQMDGAGRSRNCSPLKTPQTRNESLCVRPSRTSPGVAHGANARCFGEGGYRRHAITASNSRRSCRGCIEIEGADVLHAAALRHKFSDLPEAYVEEAAALIARRREMEAFVEVLA